tara:strand:+ start:302 stop:502 length:201 start_codon:yes stop_codon:yes gene_type:complete
MEQPLLTVNGSVPKATIVPKGPLLPQLVRKENTTYSQKLQIQIIAKIAQQAMIANLAPKPIKENWL